MSNEYVLDDISWELEGMLNDLIEIQTDIHDVAPQMDKTVSEIIVLLQNLKEEIEEEMDTEIEEAESEEETA